MYTVINRYQVLSETSRQGMQQMRKSLLAVLSRIPGLKACYLAEVADLQVASISLFETKADAQAATVAIADWIAEQGTLLREDFSEAAMSGMTTTIFERAEEKQHIHQLLSTHESDLFYTTRAHH
jgi:hypothetical protein